MISSEPQVSAIVDFDHLPQSFDNFVDIEIEYADIVGHNTSYKGEAADISKSNQ